MVEFLLKEWQETWTPELLEREINIGILPKKVRKIIVFTGIRRSGKTYIMFQLMQELAKKHSKEDIFYINFEDERLEKKKESLTKIIPALVKLYGDRKRYFLFLDEVQVMPEWSRWLRRIYDNYREISLFVSGSSAKVASKEIPTELRGRALDFGIFPLSFKEYLKFKNIILEKDFQYSEKKLSLLKNALHQYLVYGGFPEVVLEDSIANKKRLLQDYYNTIIARDIIERNKIKKTELLHDFLRLLLNSQNFSINKAYNIFKSQNKKAGKETLIKYTKYCTDAYFCFIVPIFSYKIKDQMHYSKKVYFADSGFLTNLSLKFSEDFGRLFENAVFIELKRKQLSNLQEIFYWKSQKNEEVDFVIKEGLKIKQLIQVCYDTSDYDTKKREVRALVKASNELKCKDLLIINDSYDGVERVKNKKIVYIPLWRWLLGDVKNPH